MPDYRPSDRDSAFRRVASWTTGGVSGVIVLTGALSAASAASFAAVSASSSPPAAPPIPPETAPVQGVRPTPAVIVQVVHVPAAAAGRYAQSSGIAAPRKAPSGGGSSAAPPPPPPPPPVCHSTPSHPC